MKPRHEAFRLLCDLEHLRIVKGCGPATDDVRAKAARLLALCEEQGMEAESSRLSDLLRAGGVPADYRDRHGVAGVRRFQSAGGATAYLAPVETFPDHVNNIYFVRDGATLTMIDAGSGAAFTKEDLARGIEVIGAVFGERLTLDDVNHIILTHCHIDHFGNINNVRGRAQVWVHALDAKVLWNYNERLVVSSKDMSIFLRRAGMPDDDREKAFSLYMAAKSIFDSTRVDQVVEDGQEIIAGYRVHHTPGHSAGLICLSVHDLLFTADHVLSRITPHVPPEFLTPSTGLEHHLASLRRMGALPGVTIALPAHEEPIPDFAGRVNDTIDFHHRRLDKVLEICRTPRTMWEITTALFTTRLVGYGRLLGLQEAAAHVEYLQQRGAICIANVDKIEKSDDPVLVYRARQVPCP